MRALAFAGLLGLFFGLGASYAVGARGLFPLLNLGGGGLCLLLALILGVRRLGRSQGSDARRLLARGGLRTLLLIAAAIAGQRLAEAAGLRSDWTFEQRLELAPVTLEACRALPDLRIELFGEPGDPRLRHTRQLLRALGQACPVAVAERELSEEGFAGEDFEVTRSNSLVLAAGGRFELVERPLEGALFEALTHLQRPERGALGVLRGAGGGDTTDPGPRGFSGLAAALSTEGYRLVDLLAPTLAEIPPGVGGVLVLAPERRLPGASLQALERFLQRGGRLLALLEPGQESGVEALLGEWGLSSPNQTLMEPASGPLLGLPAGVAIAASHYETHPITRGLDANRMTFLAGARPFELHKPEAGDVLDELVWSSSDAWLAEGGRSAAPGAYRAVAAAGRYPRPGGEARIVAFGDSDFARNRLLRAVYNLDLILNSAHWLMQQEPAIALRPKVRGLIQFPLPLAETLTTFYGVGLLLPELLLLAAGLLWLRDGV